jgi:caa(3)-type oxidase subunit IV
MTHAAATADAHGHNVHGHDAHAEHVHEPSHYIKIWALLVVLLFVSIAGPMLGIKLVTLLTAFGIAIVKAYIVCAYFMHLNIEKKYAVYLLCTALVFIALFYFAVAPDVMKHDGQNWNNAAAKAKTQQVTAEHAAAGPAHH